MSQPGPVMPTTARTLLISRRTGSIKILKVMPMPIVDTRTGKNTTERRYPRAMICEVSRMPSASPSTTLLPEVTTP